MRLKKSVFKIKSLGSAEIPNEVYSYYKILKFKELNLSSNMIGIYQSPLELTKQVQN